MRYALAMLAHGDSLHGERALASFAEHVTPRPVVTIYHHDGPGEAPLAALAKPTLLSSTSRRNGFCASVAALWQRTIETADTFDYDYVFWLEHDFEFLRPVDLEELRGLVDTPKFAQVSLMRQPVNDLERKQGVLPAADAQHWTEVGGTGEFLEHGRYFTTNPSLMSVAFMEANPWPDYPAECEGRFGLELVERGYRFAVWGNGEPWVEHVGERSGHGY